MRKILFLGDSVMAGYTVRAGVGCISEHSVPAACGRLFGAGVRVENGAIGGTASPEWLHGGPGISMGFAARMACSDAHFVVINTAINDVFRIGVNMDLAGYQYCYSQFAWLAQQAGKRMVFMTPNPINDPHNAGLWGLKNIAQNVVARQHGVPVIDQWDAIAHACPQWPTQLVDAVHPNDALHRFMGHVAFMTLAPLLAEGGAA